MLDESALGCFSGTENWTRWNSKLFPNMLLTDGALHVAEKGGGQGAYWLINAIASYQPFPPCAHEPFQHWKLTVAENKSADLVGDDGNGNELVRQKFVVTDFDLPEIEFYVSQSGNVRVIMLPSEY